MKRVINYFLAKPRIKNYLYSFYSNYQKYESKARYMSMRIYLTEACNAKCKNCFNKDIRNPVEMDFEKLKKLFRFLYDHRMANLRVMGGEPLLHSRFTEVYEIAQKHFPIVGLFTNGLSDKIFEIHPRPFDAITYNFNFINNSFNFDKLLPRYKQFFRGFEIMITADSDIDSIISKIDLVMKMRKRLNIPPKYMRYQLTLNCMENIMAKKKILNKKFIRVVECLHKLSQDNIDFDHAVPICFWEDKSIEKLEQLKLFQPIYKTCPVNDTGLLDAEFNLLHCNQLPKKIMNIFESGKDGLQIVDYDRIINKLIEANLEKKIHNLRKFCHDCEHFFYECTGGCFIHKPFISSKESW